MQNTQAPSPILSVKDIQKAFGGVRALEGVSVDFYPGEVHCVVGENGAGKSTLMKIISGILKRNAGEITYFGKSRSRVGETTALHAARVPHGDLPLQLGQDTWMAPPTRRSRGVHRTTSAALGSAQWPWGQIRAIWTGRLRE